MVEILAMATIIAPVTWGSVRSRKKGNTIK